MPAEKQREIRSLESAFHIYLNETSHYNDKAIKVNKVWIDFPTLIMRNAKALSLSMFCRQRLLRLEPRHEKICFIPYANNKDALVQSDQHLCCSLPG